MLEFEVEDTVVNRAKAQGWYIRKLQWTGRTGAPDRFFAKDGRIVLIEFKSPTGTIKARQFREAEKLRKAGVEVHFVRSVEMAERILGL